MQGHTRTAAPRSRLALLGVSALLILSLLPLVGASARPADQNVLASACQNPAQGQARWTTTHPIFSPTPTPWHDDNPPAAKGADGSFISPFRPTAFTAPRPVTFAKWWSSFIWPFFGPFDPLQVAGARFYADPLALSPQPIGLRVSAPPIAEVSRSAIDFGPYGAEAHYHENPPIGTGPRFVPLDFTMGMTATSTTTSVPAPMNVAGTTAPRYSDFAVTGRWSDTTQNLSMDVTTGHGMSFLYVDNLSTNGFPYLFLSDQPSPARNLTEFFPGLGNTPGNVVGFSIFGNDYALFGPTGSTWQRINLGTNLAGYILQRPQPQSMSYYSVALLPKHPTQTQTQRLQQFQTYAYSFPVTTVVGWNYLPTGAPGVPSTNQVFGSYIAVTAAKEGTNQGAPLALYRHQWLNHSPIGATGVPGGTISQYTYYGPNSGPRGEMKVVLPVGPNQVFFTRSTFTGVTPTLPLVAFGAGTPERARLDQFLAAELQAIQPNAANILIGYKLGDNTYGQGVGMNRLVQFAHIYHQLGQTANRDIVVNALKQVLSDWFTATAAKSNHLYEYNGDWNALIGYHAGFGSSTNLNDHPLHYGYWVQAAATIAMYDTTGWASDDQFGCMVKAIIKDVANYDPSDSRFARLNFFDPYAGHFWAAGHGNFAHGNNLESSSEAMNFASGLILWAMVTNDRAALDAGVFMYTEQALAVEQYWFDVDQQVFPTNFANDPPVTRPATAIVWSTGDSASPWFGGSAVEFAHGINFLPLTGGSTYLGRRPDYVQRNFNAIISNVATECAGTTKNKDNCVNRPGGVTERFWDDVLWQFLAFADPSNALARFEANCTAIPCQYRSYSPTQFNGPTPVPDSGDGRWEGSTMAGTYHWLRNMFILGRVELTIVGDVPLSMVFNSGGVLTYVVYNPSPTAVIPTVTFRQGANVVKTLTNIPPNTIFSSQ